MLEFLIDNIFVSFGGTLFQQVVGIPMGTNCAPLLADLFLYSYESQEFRIIAIGPCIANQLRDVNTICRRSWYIAAHIWKIYDFKIEVVPFIINFRFRYQDLVEIYSVSAETIINDGFSYSENV
jgi:hypothetical protein